jgi:O-acetyl-ADP-ribose deacetylase
MKPENHIGLKVIRGDITSLDVDAIVNAANNSLMGGGGVDGAIHRAGGPAILAACKKIVQQQGECKTGEAVITTGGNLPAKYVIHTVGPVWHGGKHGEEAQLADAYRNSIQLAVKHQIKSLAFPNISTGVYHFPKEKAARIAIDTVKDFLNNDKTIEEVFFVCHDAENFQIYSELLITE